MDDIYRIIIKCYIIYHYIFSYNYKYIGKEINILILNFKTIIKIWNINQKKLIFLI
jgi:hypothetical protein